MNALPASCSSVALLALMLAGTALAQPRQPLAAPPQLPAADASHAHKQRQVIRLPESERAPQRARQDEPLAEPAPEDLLAPAVQTSAEVRIEQRRQANRVVEVIVTPAGSTTSYAIRNREGARTLSQQELTAGLSVPRFIRLEF